MRIVTWNIELGRNLDLAAAELTEHPELQNADVVLLQEMSPDGADRMAERLGMDVRFDAAAHHPATGRPFGNAIMSPWPIGDAEHLLLPHVAPVQGQARSALLAPVSIDGDELLVGSVHLETVLLDLRRRRRQLRPVADRLADEQLPVVIGGDLNSASRRSRRSFERVLADAALERLSSADLATFYRFGRSYLLDHLFGRGVTRHDSGVVERTRASDHDPVWAEIALAT